MNPASHHVGQHLRATAPRNLERAWIGYGEGGQRLFLIPGLKLVLAITAGNYNANDQSIPPTRVLREVVLESIL